jgi:RPA family protein
MRSFNLLLPAILVGGLCISSLAFAADKLTAILTMHNQQFDPNMLIVPAGVKVKIVIRNLDSIPDEFESYDLSREVFVPAHGEVAIYVGPLNPGTYQIFNDFNLPMEGLIVAKQAVKNGN